MDDLDGFAALREAGTGGDRDDGGGDQGDDDQDGGGEACRLPVRAATREAQAAPVATSVPGAACIQRGFERVRRAGPDPAGGDDGGDGQGELRDILAEPGVEEAVDGVAAQYGRVG